MVLLSDAGTKVEHATTNMPKLVSSSSSPVAGSKSDDLGPNTVKKSPKSSNFPPARTDKPRPHTCSTCGRSFARLEHLKRHERSHTKEKPFECSECKRCFARRDLLLRHMQKLHAESTQVRTRNRRESSSGAMPGVSRARKNSIAGTSITSTVVAVNAVAGPNVRPRANTISTFDGTHMAMMASAQANIARAVPAMHNRHPSLVGLSFQAINQPYGMASAMSQRGMPNGLPKLDTHGINHMSFGCGLRTAPPLPFNPDYDFSAPLLTAASSTTINPNALHYNESPQSMVMDPLSPFAAQAMNEFSSSPNACNDDTLNWLTGFEQGLTLANEPGDTAGDGSSPSAMSSASQSISDVMLDGSNTATSSMWHPGLMGPPQLNHLSFDIPHSVFPDLLSGAPVSPMTHADKNVVDGYFTTPPRSLSSLSPPVGSALPGMRTCQNLDPTLSFMARPDTPSSMNGSSNHGLSPVSTITDSTRNTILGALQACQASPFGTRRYSFATTPSSMTMHLSSSSRCGADMTNGLPSIQDLRRYVAAYLRHFHPHLPFLHLPTLSFEAAITPLARGRSHEFGGTGCLILPMAAIGALFENEQEASTELFGKAKMMMQLYLEEKRKENVRKADYRRNSMTEHTVLQQQKGLHETPVSVVQAMLLNVIYGHNCEDKRTGDMASTHAAALVSLAQGADLLKPVRIEAADSRDMMMLDGGGTWFGDRMRKHESEEQAEWLKWRAMEERKRTLFSVFVLSSLLVSAYNHTPALTNSDILLDLPCDEEFFAAPSSAAFEALGGIAMASHNRMSFHEALSSLLQTHTKQCMRGDPVAAAASNLLDTPLKPSSFGCLILICALHNHIGETRQHHSSKMWSPEETEKMHQHIEPALQAWHRAWASRPHHSAARPNPYGKGPLSADSIPLLDLAYVRLFVNLSRSKEKFCERDWDGMAEELSYGSQMMQHDALSPVPKPDSSAVEACDPPPSSVGFVDFPPTMSPPPNEPAAGLSLSLQSATGVVIPRRERHLRKAASHAADSLLLSGKLGMSFADCTSVELPLQSALCEFDCTQVLAEWVATLQDRVGRYVGILGRDDMDLGQVPAVMLLEDEDMRLLGKIRDIIGYAEQKMNREMMTLMGGDGFNIIFGAMDVAMSGMDIKATVDANAGYAAKILRVMAVEMENSGVWPVTRLMANCLQTHANHMRVRAERSVMALE